MNKRTDNQAADQTASEVSAEVGTVRTHCLYMENIFAEESNPLTKIMDINHSFV